ncbi:MAG: alpha/beta hydrolase [Planctomycetes bacterium]|nr:alpha/beta hydrolase [Planctomycetota bacterium]
MRPVFLRSGLLFLLATLGSGCAGVSASRYAATPRPDAPPPQAVVFVVDGVGNFGATSSSLSRAIDETGLPLHVHTVEWSHGYGRIFADHMDHCHARNEGRKLAEQIACYQRPRADGPPLPIYLIAHSGGSAVALAATEFLPPDSVERIVLLAPSVSAQYDLRPALRCARLGMDVFHSHRDLAVLGLGVGIIGTADRRWTAAAGRVGFRPPEASLPDAVLYLKLRQHPWDPCVGWTGNQGGHEGAHHVRFLRAYVLPLFAERGT